MRKSTTLFSLCILFFAAEVNAQPIIGTWNVAVLAEKVKVRITVGTSKIVIHTTTPQYTYDETENDSPSYEERVQYRGDTTTTSELSIKKLYYNEMQQKGYVIAQEISKKRRKKINFMIFTYQIVDSSEIEFGMDEKYDRVKTLKEAETLAQLDGSAPVFRLISDEKYQYFKTLKDPLTITREELLAILQYIRSLIFNKAADIQNGGGYAFFLKIQDILSKEFEALGYNPTESAPAFKNIMKQYKNDPEIEKINSEIEQTFKTR